MFVLYLVSAGAAWTSVGLALSTWVPRLGRAVSGAVGLYAIVNLTCVVLNEVNHVSDGRGLSEISPFYGSCFLTHSIIFQDLRDYYIAWGLFCTLANTAVAVILLLATLATFNRCLGRIG